MARLDGMGVMDVGRRERRGSGLGSVWADLQWERSERLDETAGKGSLFATRLKGECGPT